MAAARTAPLYNYPSCAYAAGFNSSQCVPMRVPLIKGRPFAPRFELRGLRSNSRSTGTRYSTLQGRGTRREESVTTSATDVKDDEKKKWADLRVGYQVDRQTPLPTWLFCFSPYTASTVRSNANQGLALSLPVPFTACSC
jgi:hypothetical protein